MFRNSGFRWSAAILAVTLAVLGLAASPAAAHNAEVRLTTPGGVLMGSAAVTAQHTTISVCDPRRDGVIVRAHYVLSNSSVRRTMEIPDMAGCRRAPVTFTADPVTRIQVCARGGFSSCTAMVRA